MFSCYHNQYSFHSLILSSAGDEKKETCGDWVTTSNNEFSCYFVQLTSPWFSNILIRREGNFEKGFGSNNYLVSLSRSGSTEMFVRKIVKAHRQIDKPIDWKLVHRLAENYPIFISRNLNLSCNQTLVQLYFSTTLTNQILIGRISSSPKLFILNQDLQETGVVNL